MDLFSLPALSISSSRFALSIIFSGLILSGCHHPYVVNSQDELFCETQGFRAGTDANVNCAMKHELDRDAAGGAHPNAQPAPNMPMPNVPPPPPVHPGGVSQTISISVAPGATKTINFSFSVNSDCIAVGLPDVKIDKQPTHGVVKLIPREDFARASQLNFPASCGVRRVRGIAVEYSSNKDYTGADFIQFETATTTGSTSFKVPITVEKPSDEDE